MHILFMPERLWGRTRQRAPGTTSHGALSAWRRATGALAATALVCAALVVPSLARAAAAWPTKPVRVVVAFPAGGATDILGRALAAELARELGQQFVVENRPGAGGFIGAEAAAGAAADGYTLFLCAITNQAIANNVYTRRPVDLLKEFVPVATVANIPHMLVINGSLQANSLGEFVQYLKSQAGPVNYASQGNGTLSHLESELLLQKAGVRATHVPYKGSSNALPDLVAGNVVFMFDSVPAALPHVKAGRLRALAVASGTRTSALPTLPTVAEAGLSGYEVNNWFGFLAPAGTPANVVTTLNAALARIAQQRDLRERLVAQGVELTHAGPEATGLTIAKELAKWGRVVKDAQIRVD